jgi:hypothetical protein
LYILTGFFLSVAPNPIRPGFENTTLGPLPPNPCSPTPCGPNSRCQVVSGLAQCDCLSNMIGVAPNCRPECLLSSDCASSLACVNQKCINPCLGLCGDNAECRVVNHSPVCSCIQGFTGDAFSDCNPNPVVGKNFYLETIHFLCGLPQQTSNRRKCIISVHFYFIASSIVYHLFLGPPILPYPLVLQYPNFIDFWCGFYFQVPVNL